MSEGVEEGDRKRDGGKRDLPSNRKLGKKLRQKGNKFNTEEVRRRKERGRRERGKRRRDKKGERGLKGRGEEQGVGEKGKRREDGRKNECRRENRG